MAVTPKPPGELAPPNDQVPIAEGQVAIPNNQTPESEGAIAIPNDQTALAAGQVAIPNNQTEEAVVDMAIPNNQTEKAVVDIAIPNNQAALAASAFPRSLSPLVTMDFVAGCYAQCNVPVLFDDLFTYSRSSSATFINRRIVCGKAEFFVDTDFVGDVENLLTFSEQLDDPSWVKTRTSVSPNTINGPFGGTTADTLIEDATASNTHVIQASSAAFTSGNTYTASFFAKAKERSEIQINFGSSAFASNPNAFFNLQSGTVGAIGSGADSASIEPLADGWFRCSVTATADATASTKTEIRLALDGSNSYTGDEVSGLYLWGAQVTESAKPVPYVQTFSVPVTETFTESLRIEFDPETGENLGALIEGSSTNLFERSEEFNDAAWSKTRSSITENATVAPDGTTSADTLIEDSTASSTHQVSNTTSVTSGLVYTQTVFAKAKERSEILINLGSSRFPTAANAFFNLLNGTVGQIGAGADSANIKDVGNGWFKCSITSTSDSTGSTGMEFRLAQGGTSSYSGDGSSGVFIWGAQFEQQPFATSYIRTEGSAVARSADILSLPSSVAFKSGDMTISLEANILLPVGGSGGLRYFFGQAGFNATDSNLRIGTTGLLQDKHGESAATITGTLTSNVKLSMAYDFATLGRSTYINGVLAENNVSSAPFNPDFSSNTFIGADAGGGNRISGHIKKFTTHNVTLTAQEVALL